MLFKTVLLPLKTILRKSKLGYKFTFGEKINRPLFLHYRICFLFFTFFVYQLKTRMISGEPDLKFKVPRVHHMAAASEIGPYQTPLHCFNRSGWKILLCITKNANTPGDLFCDSA